MDKLTALKVFCAVIEAGGFAPAADRLGLSTTAVSRHVAQLETQLGIRLLQRTTRRMRPTDEGLAYYERCTQVLHELDEADALVSGTALRPSGRLRITAPIALATLRLAPALAEFARLHPQLELDLVLSDHLVDLTEEGIDIAIRVGRVGNENLVARQIAETEILLAASPELAAKVMILPEVDDAVLHALTRHCRFAVSASHGEGWGLPVSEALCEQVLSLPMHPYMTEADATRATGVVLAAL